MQQPTADWERLRADVRRLIGRRAPTPADAEDVAQEVLARVWRHASTLREDERFTGWLRRIVDNTLVDHLRVRMRHPLVHDPAATETLAVSDEPPSASDEAKRHVVAVIRPFVEALPAPYREALVLSELDGLTHADIAARTGISVSGIKSRVQRGRVLLREALARCCEMGLDARNTVVSCEPRADGAAPAGCCEPRDQREAPAPNCPPAGHTSRG